MKSALIDVSRSTRHEDAAEQRLDVSTSLSAVKPNHDFVAFLFAGGFLAFSKSSVVGAPGSEGLRMCSLLP